MSGRPADFDALRELIKDFLAEPSTKKKTRLRKMLERMEKSTSGQIKLLEYGWGKVPEVVESGGGWTLKVEGLQAALDTIYARRDRPSN